eukprot:1157031-Pelagomonas_calceolata.AAC.6
MQRHWTRLTRVSLPHIMLNYSLLWQQKGPVVIWGVYESTAGGNRLRTEASTSCSAGYLALAPSSILVPSSAPSGIELWAYFTE